MQLKVNYQRVWKTFQYSYFFNVNVSFQSYVCDSFHDLLQKATSCEKVAIISMRGKNLFWVANKDKAVSLIEIANLNEKKIINS